jgi:uncharacterized protein
VKIRIDTIQETEREASFVEEVTEINAALARTGVVDYQFVRAVPVDVSFYRLGSDLLFRGSFAGAVAGTCARCVETYLFTMREPFTFVLKPQSQAAAERELAAEDLSLSFYSGDEVDLAPLVREAMILALPTRPLCKEDCLGLCPQCGANRNLGACGCRDEWLDPRLEALRSLKSSGK